MYNNVDNINTAINELLNPYSKLHLDSELKEKLKKATELCKQNEIDKLDRIYKDEEGNYSFLNNLNEITSDKNMFKYIFNMQYYATPIIRLDIVNKIKDRYYGFHKISDYYRSSMLEEVIKQNEVLLLLEKITLSLKVNKLCGFIYRNKILKISHILNRN